MNEIQPNLQKGQAANRAAYSLLGGHIEFMRTKEITHHFGYIIGIIATAILFPGCGSTSPIVQQQHYRFYVREQLKQNKVAVLLCGNKLWDPSVIFPDIYRVDETNFSRFSQEDPVKAPLLLAVGFHTVTFSAHSGVEWAAVRADPITYKICVVPVETNAPNDGSILYLEAGNVYFCTLNMHRVNKQPGIYNESTYSIDFTKRKWGGY